MIFQQPILLLCSSGLCSFHIQKASPLENRQTQKNRAEWVGTDKGIQPENPQNWAKFYETKTTQKRFSTRNANVVLHSAAKLTSDSNREMECQGGDALVLLLFYSLSLSLALDNFITQGRKVKITANDLPFFTHGNFRKGFFVVFFAILWDQKIGEFKTPFKKQKK